MEPRDIATSSRDCFRDFHKTQSPRAEEEDYLHDINNRKKVALGEKSETDKVVQVTTAASWDPETDGLIHFKHSNVHSLMLCWLLLTLVPLSHEQRFVSNK